ncbi:MAG: hypothetical protein II627_06795, partial [Lachnospiraceae bacterium]|nr:hypothetical protein [Lachnospiraceae bacterium]
YPLEATRYVLLDLSAMSHPASHPASYRASDKEPDPGIIIDLTRHLQKAGYIPIYVRPEYLDVLVQDPDLCADVLYEGGLFLGSKRGLLGRLGRRSQDALLYMISQGYIAAIASFAVHHEFDTPHLGEAGALLASEFSVSAAELLLDVNPGRILRGEMPFVPDFAERPID